MYFENAGMAASRAASAQAQYVNSAARSNEAQLAFEQYVQNPEITKAIAEQAGNDTLLVMKIAEAKKIEALPMQEAAYMQSAQVKLQEDYLQQIQQAQAEAAPDGSGYLDSMNRFFDVASKAALEDAPSEAAKNAMYAQVQAMRLDSLKDGIVFQDKRRREWSFQQASASADSLAKQATLDPDNLGVYQAQAANLAQTLMAAGVEPADAEKLGRQAVEGVTSGYMYRRISDDPEGALDELISGVHNDALSSRQLISNISQAWDSTVQVRKERAIAVEQQQAVNRLATNIPLDATNKNDVKVAQDFYSSVTSALRDPATGALAVDPRQASEIVYQAVKKIPNIIPAEAVNDISTSINSGTPDKAVAMSQLVQRLMADPTQANKIDKLGSSLVQMGSVIARSVAAGESPENAVMDARKQFLVKSDSITAQRNREVDSLVTSEYVKEQLDNQFTSWVAPIVGVNQWFEGKGFSAAASQFFNPENLGAASEDYQRLFRRAYLDSGDADAANEYARTQLARTWTPTYINGRNEIMHYGPEAVFPGREADFREKWNATKEGLMSTHEDKTDFILSSQDYFGNNYAALAGVYPVSYLDKTGIQRPLLDDEGQQVMFEYTKGFTHEEIEVLEELRARQQQEQVNQPPSIMNMRERVMASEGYKKLNKQEQALLRQQLIPTIIGK